MGAVAPGRARAPHEAREAWAICHVTPACLRERRPGLGVSCCGRFCLATPPPGGRPFAGNLPPVEADQLATHRSQTAGRRGGDGPGPARQPGRLPPPRRPCGPQPYREWKVADPQPMTPDPGRPWNRGFPWRARPRGGNLRYGPGRHPTASREVQSRHQKQNPRPGRTFVARQPAKFGGPPRGGGPWSCGTFSR